METIKKKIALGLPSYDGYKTETVMCLLLAVAELRDYETLPLFRKGTYIHESRNYLVKEAFENDADYLMFIDADLAFNPDSITRLLSRDKDIIGGNYHYKQMPLASTVKIAGEDGELIQVENYKFPDEPFKCYAVPTGFMLIRLKAIKDMRFPFDFGRNPDGSLIGEDVNFCKRVQSELGLEVWCDPTIKIAHLGDYAY